MPCQLFNRVVFKHLTTHACTKNTIFSVLLTFTVPGDFLHNFVKLEKRPDQVRLFMIPTKTSCCCCLCLVCGLWAGGQRGATNTFRGQEVGHPCMVANKVDK